MEAVLLTIILVVGLVILYFQIKAKTKQEENLNEKIKDELNSIKTSFSDSFGTMTKDIAKDMTGALTKVDEKVLNFNQQIQTINESQNNFSRILAGVKQYGGLSEFSLASILEDLLPASQYIANAKMKPEETRDLVEFAVKLQNNILCPIDSHWPIEKYKAVDEAFQEKDKEALATARNDLATAFRTKYRNVSQKYINPPISTDFAIIYVPTEGLYAELSSFRDPKTKELLLEELRKKYKVTIVYLTIGYREDFVVCGYCNRKFIYNEIEKNDIIMDIGPKTINKINKIIKKAKTIVWNGPLGVFEFKQFSEGTKNLTKAIAASSAYSIAGGGDTIAAISKF